MMLDLKCIAAALCFLVSNILFIVHGVLAMYGSQNSQMANANDSNINQGVYDSDNNYPDNKDAVQSMAKPTSWNYEYWTDLDPVYIQERWVQREQQRPIMMSAAVSTLNYLSLFVCFFDASCANN